MSDRGRAGGLRALAHGDLRVRCRPEPLKSDPSDGRAHLAVAAPTGRGSASKAAGVAVRDLVEVAHRLNRVQFAAADRAKDRGQGEAGAFRDLLSHQHGSTGVADDPIMPLDRSDSCRDVPSFWASRFWSIECSSCLGNRAAVNEIGESNA